MSLVKIPFVVGLYTPATGLDGICCSVRDADDLRREGYRPWAPPPRDGKGRSAQGREEEEAVEHGSPDPTHGSVVQSAPRRTMGQKRQNNKSRQQSCEKTVAIATTSEQTKGAPHHVN